MRDTDGNCIVFSSYASNLINNDTNNHADVFLWEKGKGITLISKNNNGIQANQDCWVTGMSADGNIIMFTSRASNLVYFSVP